MARSDERFRSAFNGLLDICNSLEPGDSLTSEVALAGKLNVSRTVIRNVLQSLHQQGIINWDGRKKTLQRKPHKNERMKIKEEAPSFDELEARFLDWILRFDVPQNTVLNVTQLSRQFSVAPHTLQEFLSSLSRFGLVERRPKGGWALSGFTAEFAVELSDFRVVLELNAIKYLVKLPDDHPVWAQLEQLKADHHDLLKRIDTDFHDFSRLDEVYHSVINDVVKNRFAKEFQKIIPIIFHYHFQWDKSDERIRNENAIKEHLVCIDNLLKRDAPAAEAAVINHLETSKQTLLRSLRVHNFA